MSTYARNLTPIKKTVISTYNDHYSYNKSQGDALFLKFILVKNSTCFGQTYCPSSGVSILTSLADS